MVVPALDHRRHRFGSYRGFLVVAWKPLDQPPHCSRRGCLVAAVSGDRARGLPLW